MMITQLLPFVYVRLDRQIQALVYLKMRDAWIADMPSQLTSSDPKQAGNGS
jgi:hypothetical protein